MKVIVSEWMSLDGVVQAPIERDEDTSGGFAHGGWHLRYFDRVSQDWAVENVTQASGFLLGGRTYEQFAAHWPHAGEEEQVLARPLNTKPKYVASTSLAAPLAWQNATLLQGDIAAAVAALIQDGDGDLLVLGSTRLVPMLLQHDLVDELRLMIDPVILGGGKRIFPVDGMQRSFRLARSQVATTGAILATYARAAG